MLLELGHFFFWYPGWSLIIPKERRVELEVIRLLGFTE